jgi:Uncharacterized protein conserved in bacteria
MTRRRRVWWLLLALPGLALGAAQPKPAPFLWSVERGATRNYLMGSVHLLPSSEDTLPDALESAYDASTGIVLETDLAALDTHQTQLRMVAAARRPTPLRQRIGSRLYARVRARAQRVDMSMKLCDGFAAWFCGVALDLYDFQQAGFSSEYGIDRHFYGEALNDGKTIRWLEPVSQHIDLFTGLDAASGRALLESAVEQGAEGHRSGSADTPAALLRAWRDDDTRAVAALDIHMAQRHPALYRRFIADRNQSWLPQLEQLFASGGPRLVIVGAAHCVGPDGLVALLRAAGYRVRPVAAHVPEVRLDSARAQSRRGRARGA